MRVITGTARGRRLEPPQGNDTRPTSEMVKEAVMSILQFELEGALFLDAFAGCGQIGIEALSRGARKAVFLDSSNQACALIRKNLKSVGFSEASQVVNADTLSWLKNTAETFDIAYVDPPYGQGIVAEILPVLAQKMSANGIILAEVAKNDALPQKVAGFEMMREYNYGKIKVVKYTQPPAEA